MNIHQHAALLDHLAAAYAVGMLHPRVRRRLEAHARAHPVVRAQIVLWQERMSGLAELQPEVEPDPAVWRRIENLVRAPAGPARPARSDAVASELLNGFQRALGWWKLAGWTAGAAAAAGVVASVSLAVDRAELSDALAQSRAQAAALTAQIQAAARIEYVAVLSDEKAQASMLVTFDAAKQRLTLKRVGGYQEAADRSLQLWALPPGQSPQSLGVIGRDALVRLTAQTGQVNDVPALAISLEPQGGAPAGSGPTGPVLFKGALLRAPV